jgi:beta-galactosidase
VSAEGRLAHLRARLGGRIGFGGDYNPEQWPEATWPEDVALMAEAGVNLVTVGIFSWARIEPRPGEFDFDWLDRVLDLLHAGGIAVDLATATASPPAWLVRAHPEVLPVTEDGVRLEHGARQHYCPSSAAYREAALRVVEALAARYGDHPALALWHVGNEFGVHTPACYCDASAEHFRDWLRDRFGDVEALNRAWGTDFWSQRYGSFEEVNPPRRAPTFRNPGQLLDWRRFCSDALLECYRAERDVLRRATPHVPVTTNSYAPLDRLDLWAWAAEEDVVSHGSYPDPADPGAAVGAAMTADLMRSLRGGQPWLLMEQAAGAVNWRPVNAPKPPGVMRLWSLQALARGADGLLFFQWRASARGAERFHSGMLPHGGRETRTFREVRELGAELPRLAGLAGARVHAEVAFVLSWDAWWALESGPRPSLDLGLPDQLLACYAALHELNVTVDFRPPGVDLSAYRLVLVPSLFSIGDDEAAALEAYVARGGYLVVCFFSGIADHEGAVRTGGHPGAFRDLLGLVVDDFWPLAAGETVALAWRDGTPAGSASKWSEWVEPRAAEVLMTFADGELAGRPAATRNGRALYLATRPDPATMRAFMSDACAAAGVRAAFQAAPHGVEAVRRGDALVLLNHRSEPAEIALAGETISLGGRDVRVLQASPLGRDAATAAGGAEATP